MTRYFVTTKEWTAKMRHHDYVNYYETDSAGERISPTLYSPTIKVRSAEGALIIQQLYARRIPKHVEVIFASNGCDGAEPMFHGIVVRNQLPAEISLLTSAETCTLPTSTHGQGLVSARSAL